MEEGRDPSPKEYLRCCLKVEGGQSGLLGIQLGIWNAIYNSLQGGRMQQWPQQRK